MTDQQQPKTNSAGRNADLHGNAPDKCQVALLIIDVINDLEFDGGEKLLETAVPMAKKLLDLKQRARAADIPVIYINDNFGRWRSNLKAQIDHCLKDGVRGEEIVRLLQPSGDDYFVLKPKHSAFFSTTLEILLEYLGTETLIMTGIASNICVLFSANDAYMRDFSLLVPADCVAANTVRENESAVEQMKNILKADVRVSTELRFVDGKVV